MSFSIFDASSVVFQHTLSQLSHLLKKGEAHAREQGLDPALLLQARLATDMFPLVRQVQSASDAAKLAVARLAGVDAPRHDDVETTFDELQQRITATLQFIAGVPRDAFEGAEERVVTLKTPRGELTFTGQSYLQHFALPNFFFHVTTSYALLRHNGVPVGKLDYLGSAR